jgi:imidazole glycerol-phosphate synthase subunit HisH
MIAIVNYGLGNIKAFANIFKNLNIDYSIASIPDELLKATKVILPGVGAFDYGIERLTLSGMKPLLDDLALIRKIPILGVCVGMQMLAESSEEGKLQGLGWINGKVKKLDSSSLIHPAKLPHMGWNDANSISDNPLFLKLEDSARFYFLHSYYFSCAQTENIIATTRYGNEFASAINAENIFGVQFHPEKSHKWGIQLLKNFANL